MAFPCCWEKGFNRFLARLPLLQDDVEIIPLDQAELIGACMLCLKNIARDLHSAVCDEKKSIIEWEEFLQHILEKYLPYESLLLSKWETLLCALWDKREEKISFSRFLQIGRQMSSSARSGFQTSYI